MLTEKDIASKPSPGYALGVEILTKTLAITISAILR